MPSRIVTATYRYKRPPRKRKAVPLEGPAIMQKRAPPSQQASTPAPANDDRKPVIVTVKGRSSRFGDVPDMTLEEHRRRWAAPMPHAGSTKRAGCWTRLPTCWSSCAGC